LITLLFEKGFTMKKFSFAVDVVGDDVDTSAVVDALRKTLTKELSDETFANVKPAGVKAFSEQGYKVWRARVTGVTAEQAGDAHNGKVDAEAVA
jgi:hypothetical protein